MASGRRYFTESCQTITTHAIFTDGIFPSVFTITITDGYVPSVIIVENSDRCGPSVIFSWEIFFCRASPSVRPSVVGFFISDRISDGKRNYR